MATALVLPPVPEVAYFTRGSILTNGVQLEEREDGSALLKGLKVFRTGRLTDSRGNTREWTTDDLDAAVENFNMLRDELPDIPLRVGHNRDVQQVAGYYEAVRRDGNFLVADFEITEPDVVAKIQRRTYRSRSMEIGAYESERHGLCWPVPMGLAFVDLPAVSGLNYANPMTGKEFSVLVPEGDYTMAPQPTNTPDLYAAYYAQGLADGASNVKPPEPSTYQCFGAPVTDVTAVQAHIDTLEAYQRETVEAGRKAFVKSLVEGNKILAPQQEHFEKIALELSPESFETFKAGWADAPPNNTLAKFQSGPDGTPPPQSNGNEDPQAYEIKVLEDRVNMFRIGGQMTDEQIKDTPSYKRLAELTGK